MRPTVTSLWQPLWPAAVTTPVPPGGQGLDCLIHPQPKVLFWRQAGTALPTRQPLTGNPSSDWEAECQHQSHGPRSTKETGMIYYCNDKQSAAMLSAFQQPNMKAGGPLWGRGATDRHFAGIGGGFGDLVPKPQPQRTPHAPVLKTPSLILWPPREPVPALYPSSTIPDPAISSQPSFVITEVLPHSASVSRLTAREPTCIFRAPFCGCEQQE